MVNIETTDWQKIVQSILDSTGWTQAELAERTQIHQQTIHRLLKRPDQRPIYETGKKLWALYDATRSGVRLTASA